MVINGVNGASHSVVHKGFSLPQWVQQGLLQAVLQWPVGQPPPCKQALLAHVTSAHAPAIGEHEPGSAGAFAGLQPEFIQQQLKCLLGQGLLIEAPASEGSMAKGEARGEPLLLPKASPLRLWLSTTGLALCKGNWQPVLPANPTLPLSSHQKSSLATACVVRQPSRKKPASTLALSLQKVRQEARQQQAPSEENLAVGTPSLTESCETTVTALPGASVLSPAQQSLLQELRQLRHYWAQRHQVRHYRVCSNAALLAMVQRQPKCQQQLMAIPKLGPVFWERYGPAFLEVLLRVQLQGMAAPASRSVGQ